MPNESAVHIALVRPALLGTYGDGGNASVLMQRARWRGIPAVFVPLAGSEPVPESIDICLLGGAEDNAQVAIAGDVALKDSLTAAVARGAAVLGVCGGMQILGSSFAAADGSRTAGFGLLDVDTQSRLRTRATGEVLVDPDPDLSIDVLTGFENHGGATTVGPDARPLGRVVRGVGNAGDGTEGAFHDRVFGTYLHGPVLARNPTLADLLLSLVVGPLSRLEVAEVDRLRADRGVNQRRRSLKERVARHR
jgi:CobQ-like glutamine amidotransferase family enzyme